MTTTSTDMRYGRRGGGWAPQAKRTETRNPHKLRARPCPIYSCPGTAMWPIEKQTAPYSVGPCDGMWQHTVEFTPLAPHTAPAGGSS